MYKFIFYVSYNYFINAGRTPDNAKAYATSVSLIQIILNLVAVIAIFMQIFKGSQNVLFFISRNFVIVLVMIFSVSMLISKHYTPERISAESGNPLYLPAAKNIRTIGLILLAPVLAIIILSVVRLH